MDMDSRLARHAGLALAVLVMTSLALPALAHSGAGGSGFAAGLLHPVTGLDHVVAMVAVGLWGGILGAPALWQLPVAFPVAMAFAGGLAVAGVPLPGVETGIALSGVVLGAMVFLSLRPALPVALAMVGIFALFHGHAHGTELPAAANPIAYAIGFVISTGLLHLAGGALGFLWQSASGKIVVRGCGAVIALVGAAFLTGVA